MPSRRKQVTYSSRPNRAARVAHAKGDRQFRTYDTSYIRPKKSKVPLIVAAVLAVAVIGGLVWGTLTLMNSCSSQAATLPAGQTVDVVVEKGSGAQAIGQQLQKAGLVATSTDFTKRVTELGAESKLQPGTYTLAGGTSVDDLIKQLMAGPGVEGVTFTIPEGFTLKAIADRVAEVSAGRITAEAFLAAASDASAYAADYPFLAEAGTNSLEGFLFPKTYVLGDTATADSVIRMMLSQFKTEIAGLDWSYPESQGLSVYQAVTLASIVEKESSGEEKIRAQVAAVFYNRLSTMGDPSYGFLQSDATTAYEVGHDPTADEVHADTPYSTYAHKGLPPTPICSPGLDCLTAVCAPDADALGRYYFFYFEGTNYSFSETYDEHVNVINS